ncbi:GNAT family N-acetyltransferase [Mesorhizobium sp. A556]
MRGTGVAPALVNYMIEDVRKSGLKIIPICPYVRAQYRKHPDWADVMTVAPGEDRSSKACLPKVGTGFGIKTCVKSKGCDGVDAPRRHRCARMETLITF